MGDASVISRFLHAQNYRLPRTTYSGSVVYEAHVKGLTIKHPQIPKEMRGTYAAIGHPVMLEHFNRIGITAVELMPVHHFVQDHYLEERGLRNYWGYNTIGFFSPYNAYSSSG